MVVEDKEKIEMIALVTKRSKEIINNHQLTLVFANIIADIITKRTQALVENAQSDEEAKNLSMIGLLEIFVAIYKAAYNVEKVVGEKYNVPSFILDSLKYEGLMNVDKVFNNMLNREKKEKSIQENDVVGSTMYG